MESKEISLVSLLTVAFYSFLIVTLCAQWDEKRNQYSVHSANQKLTSSIRKMWAARTKVLAFKSCDLTSSSLNYWTAPRFVFILSFTNTNIPSALSRNNFKAICFLESYQTILISHKTLTQQTRSTFQIVYFWKQNDATPVSSKLPDNTTCQPLQTHNFADQNNPTPMLPATFDMEPQIAV